jgi:hypothetical protein
LLHTVIAQRDLCMYENRAKSYLLFPIVHCYDYPCCSLMLRCMINHLLNREIEYASADVTFLITLLENNLKRIASLLIHILYSPSFDINCDFERTEATFQAQLIEAPLKFFFSSSNIFVDSRCVELSLT